MKCCTHISATCVTLDLSDDAREALSGFAYNLGLGDRPPVRSPHSYIEKAEYWAVVWGAIVMIASGTLLWANNLTMKLLPKAWLDISTGKTVKKPAPSIEHRKPPGSGRGRLTHTHDA